MTISQENSYFKPSVHIENTECLRIVVKYCAIPVTKIWTKLFHVVAKLKSNLFLFRSLSSEEQGAGLTGSGSIM